MGYAENEMAALHGWGSAPTVYRDRDRATRAPGPLRIYLASSWRNPWQPSIVQDLREQGHEVYDFRHPKDGDDGFSWREIDGDWQTWTYDQYRAALQHPVARAGFKSDMDALRACDVCVLVLPCGRSAHLELGWAAGAGKGTAVLLIGENEPELMYAMLGRICVSLSEVVDFLESERRRVVGE